jgi:hypothetical protein
LSVSTTTHNLYVGSDNAGVYKVVPPYGAGNVTQIDSAFSTFGTAVDSASETVYAAAQAGNVIRIIPNGGAAANLAGSGIPGFLDGTLSLAQFDSPCGVAVVVSGGNTNIYVADRNNHAIRWINVASNSVTTLAGNGVLGCTDDTGLNAQFNQPTGCTIGPDGNLYIADQDNFIIRKVTLPGAVVTTIGGVCGVEGTTIGCGTDATFKRLGQIGINSGLVLYAADRGGRVVKGTPPITGNVVQIDFTAGPSDTADMFVLVSSSSVNGTYNTANASFSDLGGGSFRAVTLPGGSKQFYRVKRQ